MTDLDFIKLDPIPEVDLQQGNRRVKHLFELGHVQAINTALACGRPLLLTGEPGVGKTQLAQAAAHALQRAFVRSTVDAKTEARDLLWQFDAIARLADAQLAQVRGWTEEQCQQKLNLVNYLLPGPLWWGINWESAEKLVRAKAPVLHGESDQANGVVVLIDEIDKAEIDVPNGLLEALGEGSFQPEGLDQPVRAGKVPPFIVITSNRERSLPDAFVRRCVVLEMGLPRDDNELRELLVKRGKAHSSLPDETLTEAADQLIKDRNACKKPPAPGQAEYLDLLRAIEEQQGSGLSHKQLLQMVSPFLLKKGESI